ncbi:ABC transporter ATP-binding protein, partial [Mesorhizobium sp. M8A.F.Ca.ET.059.01.1.1]
MSPAHDVILKLEDVSKVYAGTVAVKQANFEVRKGAVNVLVGENGAGKSTLMKIIAGVEQPTAGRILLEGEEVSFSSSGDAVARGIGMVFQEPMTALNPVKTIGEQVAEGIRWHTSASRADAEERARKMLDRVGLPSAKFPLSRYPHELSGGQRQRVVIAIACALKPKLLIADEPTTALDVVLQAQILDLLRDLVAESRMGLLLISHDLAVVTEMADRITILRHGEVMEAGDTARTLSGQLHPYTRQLAQASMHVPARAKPHLVGTDQPLLQVKGITRDYPGRRTSLFRRAPAIRAVDDVSLSMAPGQSVALVGRSGCGKSTLARMILALDRPSSGAIRFRGEAITGKSEAELKPARRDMQVVFQDPYGSFDPRQKVEKLVAEPLHVLEKKPTRAESRVMMARAIDRRWRW